MFPALRIQYIFHNHLPCLNMEPCGRIEHLTSFLLFYGTALEEQCRDTGQKYGANTKYLHLDLSTTEIALKVSRILTSTCFCIKSSFIGFSQQSRFPTNNIYMFNYNDFKTIFNVLFIIFKHFLFF